jgi:hypothetical protein
MAPEEASPVEAREVVRHYVAALGESSAARGQDILTGFRLTRKAAQSLGEFGDILAASGLAAALAACGDNNLPQIPREEAIPALTQAWLGDHEGLEAAVARSALAACLAKVLTSDPANAPEVDGPALVRAFLAIALGQRLAFDLGESLEAAAPGWGAYRGGLARLQDELAAAAAEVSLEPPRTRQWPGLAGWVFATRTLEKVLERYQDMTPCR